MKFDGCVMGTRKRDLDRPAGAFLHVVVGNMGDPGYMLMPAPSGLQRRGAEKCVALRKLHGHNSWALPSVLG